MPYFLDIQQWKPGRKVKFLIWLNLDVYHFLFSDHHFFVAKVEIEHVGVIDYFGGVKHVAIEDYFAAKSYAQKYLFNNVEIIEIGV